MKFIQTPNIFSDLFSEYFLIISKQIESVTKTKPPTTWKNGTKGNVVLIPGFAETWVFLETIATTLNLKGYRIFIIDALGRNTSSIHTMADLVKDFIDDNHLSDIILLTHSKGGIVAKVLMLDPKYSKIISQNISIAVPYGGTALGYLQFLSLYELAPGSRLLEDIKEFNMGNIKTVNIYPKVDNHVIPNSSLILSEKADTCLNITGHTRVLESKSTTDIIVKHLAKI